MKKVFLFLSITFSHFAVCMELSDAQKRTIISQLADPLHQSLIENLDNPKPNQVKLISPIIKKIEELQLNPGILENLIDESSGIYNFATYVKKNNGKYLRVITKKDNGAPEEKILTHVKDRNWIKLADQERIHTIEVRQNLLGDKTLSKTFKLISNNSNNKQFNLLSLALQCEKPALVYKLLQSYKMPILRNISDMQSFCCENEEQITTELRKKIKQGERLLLNKRLKEWQELQHLFADSEDFNKATNIFMTGAAKVAKHAPLGLVGWYMKDRIDLSSLKKDLSILTKAALNPSTSGIGLAYIAALPSKEKIASVLMIGTDISNNNEQNHKIDLMPLTVFYGTYKLLGYWEKGLEKINNKLCLNEKIVNFFSNKPCANLLINGYRVARKVVNVTKSFTKPVIKLVGIKKEQTNNSQIPGLLKKIGEKDRQSKKSSCTIM